MQAMMFAATVVAALLLGTDAYPYKLACTKRIAVGDNYMGSSPAIASANSIKVVDSTGAVVACGSTVAADTELTVSLASSQDAKRYVLEISGGQFAAGTCDATRSNDNAATLALAAGESVSLLGAHAPRWGTVHVTETCTVSASEAVETTASPTDAPTTSPPTTAAPTKSPTTSPTTTTTASTTTSTTTVATTTAATTSTTTTAATTTTTTTAATTTTTTDSPTTAPTAPPTNLPTAPPTTTKKAANCKDNKKWKRGKGKKKLTCKKLAKMKASKMKKECKDKTKGKAGKKKLTTKQACKASCAKKCKN